MKNLRKFKKSSRKFFSPSNLYFDTEDIKNTVLVVGSGRSGTSWVTNLINADNAFRYIFEPFHPQECPYMREFPEILYLSPKTVDRNFEELVSRILKGNFHLAWTDRFNKRYISSKRIIKCIRLMLSFNWIHLHFPEIPIIYILRHPLAVINSRMNMIEKYPFWSVSKNQINELRENLIEDYPNYFSFGEINLDSEFQRQLVYWCIMNRIALDQLADIPHKLIFYENCKRNPIEAFWQVREYLSPMFDHFNKNYGEGAPSVLSKKSRNKIEIINQKISDISSQKFLVFKGKSMEERKQTWELNFDKDQKNLAQKILEKYEMASSYSVYSESPQTLKKTK